MGTDFLDKLLYEYANIKFRSKVVWPNAIGFLLLHLSAVYALYVGIFRATVLTWIFAFFLFIYAGSGVTIGAHRLYTHRSFKTTYKVRCLLMVAFTLAGENCMYIWVRDHRQHHKYSDTDADPHNSNRGFFFSHVGWLMMKKLPDVIKYGKTLDMSDIKTDPIAMFQKKYYVPLYILTNMLGIVIPCILWGESPEVSFWTTFLLRSVIVYNCTWSVNSAAHLFGTRPYNGKIAPAENNLVSALTYGEGWHNYHHTFPHDYKASEFGAKHDLSTRIINVFASWGLVYDLRQTPQHLVNQWATKSGDGTHMLAWEDDEQQTEPVKTKEEVIPEKDIIPDTCKETTDCFSIKRLNTAIA